MTKKFLIVLGALLTLTILGCDETITRKTYPLPPELSDCVVWELQNKDGNTITVMRCPNSTTSTDYKSGKSTARTVVVDGVTYTENN